METTIDLRARAVEGARKTRLVIPASKAILAVTTALDTVPWTGSFRTLRALATGAEVQVAWQAMETARLAHWAAQLLAQPLDDGCKWLTCPSDFARC